MSLLGRKCSLHLNASTNTLSYMERINQLSVLNWGYLLFICLAVLSVSAPNTVAYPLSKSPKATAPANEERSSGGFNASEPQAAPSAPKKIYVPKASVTPLSPGSHNLSLGIGQIFLTGDLSSAFDNSLGFQAQYTYGVSDLFSFEGNIGYSSHSRGAASLSTMHLITGVRSNLIYFDQLVPFLSAGLGFYRPSYTYSAGVTANSLLFGLNLGTGVDLLLSDAVFFGTRLTYHNMFSSTKGDNLGTPRTIGGAFLSFMVHVGVAF